MQNHPPSDPKMPVLSSQELYFFALFRLLASLMLIALVFTPIAALINAPVYPLMAGIIALGYLVISTVFLVTCKRFNYSQWMAIVRIAVDILVAVLMTHALPGSSAGIAMILLFNLAAAAMQLPLKHALIAAVTASFSILVEYSFLVVLDGGTHRSLAEPVMFSVTFLGIAFLTHHVKFQAKSSQALAELKTAEVLNLLEINDLIIKKMRIGVMLVDSNNHITLMNDAARQLLEGHYPKNPLLPNHSLKEAALELYYRLEEWRIHGNNSDVPLQLNPQQIEVQPQFARLLANADITLIFLDDSNVVSRRAESLTLAVMGRFSASLAHEIRNPLAAISYASQILEESEGITDEDRRLLEIIGQQCHRSNSIIESVLGLARRERANPEDIFLNDFIKRFVNEYKQTLAIETDTLEAILPALPIVAWMDQRHLQQILTALIHNAFKYGRGREQSASVSLQVFSDERYAGIDVIDRGPGINDVVLEQLFKPFFTTSEHGTGLGLYIARELCKANQATLEYLPVVGGGTCFRILLQLPQSITEY